MLKYWRQVLSLVFQCKVRIILYYEDKLNDLANCLRDFNLPTPDNIAVNDIANLKLLHELQYNREELQRFVEEMQPLLNSEQKKMCTA